MPPLSIFSKISFSKTAWPIKVEFRAQPPWLGGRKVCLGYMGHMIKMPTTHTHIYVLTAFKNATPRLNLNIFWMKNSIVVNLTASYSAIIVVHLQFIPL